MFNHTNTITPINIKTIEGPKGRFYVTPEGNKYPSITTILGDSSKQWLTDWRNALGSVNADREMKRAADRGTAVHLMVERFLNNEEDVTRGQKIEHVTEFNTLRLYLKRINNIITQESALWSDLLRAAGRVDCIAEYQGKLSIIDFKTSTTSKKNSMIDNYWMQTAAYSIMFQERYGIQVDQAVIIMSVERGAVPLVFKQDIDQHIPALLKCINTYHTKHGTKTT